MHDKNHIDDEMLIRYLLKECTHSESDSVDEWILKGAENRKYFFHLRRIWQASLAVEPTLVPDENDAWERLMLRRNEQTSKQSRSGSWLIKADWLKVAAVFLTVALSVSFAYFISTRSTNSMTVVASMHPVTDTLPDGSLVTVNRGSTLSYTGGSTRKVKLKGEAFFQVKPDKSKSFNIEVSDVEIEVVGTAFNVKEESNKVEVIVESGIVKVSRGDKMQQLNRNQKLLVTNDDTSFTATESPDRLYDYYRTNEFRCSNTPLWKVAETLSEAYETEIIVGRDELRNLPLTTTFKKQSLESILKIIEKTFDIKAYRENGKIILK